MDEALKTKTDKYLKTARMRIEDTDSKCLIEIIKLQSQRISDLEEHMKWVIRKIGDHDKTLYGCEKD